VRGAGEHAAADRGEVSIARVSFGARSSILSLSSPAAFSVKVKAMREAGSTPSVKRRTARWARTSVFSGARAGPFIDVLEDRGPGVVDGLFLCGGEGLGHRRIS
jgi:hypothetical protein